MLAVGHGTETRIDKGNQVAGNYVVQRPVLLIHEIPCHLCYWCWFLSGTWWRWWLKIWARQSIFIHDDHGLGFVRNDQIIENEILMALITPTRLVFAVPVLKVQNRISGGALVIARRRVDEDSSGLSRRFREVPFGSHRAVRYILYGEQVGTRAGNFETADFSLCGKEHPAARIVRRETVNRDRVIMKARQQRLRRNLPAVCSFDHVISCLAQFHKQLDLLGMIRLH